MSWKESKVRLFPPPPNLAISERDRKPDIQDLFLLASQATALRNTTLSVSDTQTAPEVTPSTSFKPNVALPLHPVKVEPGPHVINLPPLQKPESSISSNYDCAIMPPPPAPPKPRPSNSPVVSSTSEEHEVQAHQATNSAGQPALGKKVTLEITFRP